MIMSNSYLVGNPARSHSGHRRRYSLPARMVAEAFGTFMVTLGVLGTLAFTAVNQYIGWLVVALAAGLMLTAAMAAVGGVSGGHFNPAVTLGAALAGRTSWVNVLPYILAQILGAIAAGFVVWSIIPAGYLPLVGAENRAGLLATTASGYGANGPLSLMSGGAAEFPLGVALLAEIIFSAIFVGVVLGVMRRHHRFNPAAPLIVGLTFAAIYLISWPITGGGINPARSIASAVFAGSRPIWSQLWLFILAPLIGAALAALFYRAFQPLSHHDADIVPDLGESFGAQPQQLEATGWVQDGPARTVDVQEFTEPVVAQAPVVTETAAVVTEAAPLATDATQVIVQEDYDER